MTALATTKIPTARTIISISVVKLGTLLRRLAQGKAERRTRLVGCECRVNKPNMYDKPVEVNCTFKPVSGLPEKYIRLIFGTRALSMMMSELWVYVNARLVIDRASPHALTIESPWAINRFALRQVSSFSSRLVANA